MTRIMTLVLSLCLWSGTLAEDPGKDSPQNEEARAVLAKAAEAAAAVKFIQYQADYKGTDWIAQFVPAIEGNVVVGDQSKWNLDRFRSEIKIKAKDSDEVIELTGGSDGEVFFLIDAKTRMVHEDMDPVVMGTHSRNFQRVVVSAFAAPKPFEEEQKAKSLELKGTAEVGGVACDEIAITAADGQRTIWYFAKSDHLPRRVVRIYTNDEGKEATTDLTLTSLVVNPRIENPFKAEVPPGFTKTDEFAP